MSKIRTAEEFESSDEFFDYQSMMIAFAREHVEAALKAAHNNSQLPEEDIQFTLDCYPLTNII